MRTSSLMRVLAIALGSLPLILAAPANAASPLSVAGVWAATGNQTLGPLVIAQAVSAAECKPLTGSIFLATNQIRGFYCPETGRIVFMRHSPTGTPFQLYEGQVARDAAVDRMGGEFHIWNAAGGGFANEGPDFNFSATK